MFFAYFGAFPLVVKTTTTDSSGQFSFGSLPDGDYIINGIAPCDAGYLQAAMKRSQVIFSVVALDPSSKVGDRIINFAPNTYLSSYLVQNASTDEVLVNLAANKPTPSVFFSTVTANTDKFDHVQFKNIGYGENRPTKV